jgi:transmembrane sensor
MKSEPNNVIDLEAIEWVIRLDAAPEDAHLRAAFEHWQSLGASRRGAYIRAKAAWHAFDPLKILPAETIISPIEHRIRRRAILAGGAGAAAIAACGLGFWFRAREEVSTPIGEIRQVPLADGSLMNVNTDSSVQVTLESSLRQINLDKGEVWFQVAKDKERPFVVSAGPVRVRAVGTAFSIRRREEGADVLVTEGIVETWSQDDQSRRTRLKAGSKVFVSDNFGPEKVIAAGPDIQRTLAWRNGEIALDGQSLEEAAVEFNRYNEQKLIIDPGLADEGLTGWFRTNEPQTFADAAARVLGAVVAVNGNEIRVSRRDEK